MVLELDVGVNNACLNLPKVEGGALLAQYMSFEIPAGNVQNLTY